MSIASEITRINNNIASAYSQCQSKGATMPATQNSDNLANTISTISGGGGADLNDYFNTTIDETSSNTNPFWKTMVKKIPKLTVASGITSLAYAFYENQYENIEIEIDCSNITSFQSMFYGSTTKTLLLKFTNTDSVDNVRSMFSSCSNLESLTLLFNLSGNFETRQAFENCGSLKKLDLSNWNITGMTSSGRSQYMFRNTYKLAVLDISNMDLHNFSQTGNIFQNCGTQCLQSDGAYADGIPYVYVKNATEQAWVLNQGSQPSTWSTNNVVIKSS